MTLTPNEANAVAKYYEQLHCKHVFVGRMDGTVTDCQRCGIPHSVFMTGRRRKSA